MNIDLGKVLAFSIDSLRSRAQLRSIILDLYPHNTLEMNILLAVYESGIPREIKQKGSIDNTIYNRSINKIVNEYGLQEKHAIEGLNAWLEHILGKDVLVKIFLNPNTEQIIINNDIATSIYYNQKGNNDDIIASFIDFFDGLDTALSKKSDPELQALHRKLMDKLIVPNKISYIPVISEEFDTQKHIATDYFRSDRFPEHCIVFEVEKGYIKDDRVIKKSKVWVVQNLFKCAYCGAEQTNPEKRFCQRCGSKILAPNGLPIDNLPIFEPTAITYSRFSERMLEKGNLLKAKEYIQSGLELDSDYLPLILNMSDVLISESDFQGAIDYLICAYNIKPDERIKAKIQNIETKLSIFLQAKNLKLSSDDIDKLLHIIQK